MNCPVCTRTLTAMVAEGITLDACQGGCGGVWFDHRELKTFDEPDEATPPALLEIPRDPALQVDRSRRLKCPRCEDGAGVVMMRHFFTPKQQVAVDECPQCGGFWLDPGELAQLRSEYPSEEARRAAVDAFAHGMAAPLAEITAETIARTERVRAFTGFLRRRMYWI